MNLRTKSFALDYPNLHRLDKKDVFPLSLRFVLFSYKVNTLKIFKTDIKEKKKVKLNSEDSFTKTENQLRQTDRCVKRFRIYTCCLYLQLYKQTNGL